MRGFAYNFFLRYITPIRFYLQAQHANAREPAASTQRDGRGYSPEHLPQRYAQNGASSTAATRVPIVI